MSLARAVRSVRVALGRTQKQLGAVLGVSTKTVQSYEQGWRRVPLRVITQLLVLLALYRKRSLKEVPCWKVKNCPKRIRDACPSYTIGDGRFCWLIAEKVCRAVRGLKKEEGARGCMTRLVVARLLEGRP
jgi:DNA-binding XRE family transcriptional regulator